MSDGEPDPKRSKTMEEEGDQSGEPPPSGDTGPSSNTAALIAAAMADDSDDEFVAPVATESTTEVPALPEDGLPVGTMYEKSYQHKTIVTNVVVTPTDYVVTTSADGVLKLWRKMPRGVIFCKQFRPHMSSITAVIVNWDGTLMCTTSSNDRLVKMFDLNSYDLTHMISLDFTPSGGAFFHNKGNVFPRLALCHTDSPDISTYDPMDGEGVKLETFKIHTNPTALLSFNKPKGMMVSVDKEGEVEYWDPETKKRPPPSGKGGSGLSFKFKTSTDLFAFQAAQVRPQSLTFDPTGGRFVTWGSDGKVRVFNFTSGKLIHIFDEAAAGSKLREDPKGLEPLDVGHRLGMEKQLDSALKDGSCPSPSCVFDETGRYLLYPSILGVKVVDLSTSTKNEANVIRVLGLLDGGVRYLGLAIWQGTVKVNQTIFQLMREKHTLTVESDEPDPTVVAIAFRQSRFYLLTTRQPEEQSEDPLLVRDTINEKISGEELALQVTANPALGSGAILRTTMGDIHFKLFGEEAPKAVTNFTTHSRDGYYNHLIFHRVIKGFMIQTGDPGGDGRGGDSIWGEDFEDEITSALKFDRPFVVAMANCGPNTNGSQFFVTTVACPWLQGKHTIFGRVHKGMDVCQAIEKVSVDKRNSKPHQDVKIVNVEIVT